MGELLQQLGRAALLDRRPPVDDHVLAQSRRPHLGALERDRHVRVAADVLELPQPGIQMRGEQVVAVDGDPHARHLRPSLAADRDEMAESAAPDDLLGAVGEGHCPLMFTIQEMPNRSTHMPNSSPHTCFSSATVTMPSPLSCSQ